MTDKVMKVIGDEEVKTLKEIKESNPSAEAVLSEWASRERNRRTVNIPRLQLQLERKGKIKDTGSYLTVFKQLEQRGFGHIEDNEMILNSNLISIGKAAIEGIKERDMRRPNRVIKKSVGRPRKYKTTNLVYVYTIRPGLSIHLPDNLTQEEVAKLIQFIQSVS